VAKDIAKEKNEHGIMRVIKSAETEQYLTKYSLSPFGKSLTGFFVPFGFYVIMILGLTSIGFWLTAAIEGIFIGAIRIYRASVLPPHDDTNTLVLGIYYSSFMVSVAGYWYKIGQCALSSLSHLSVFSMTSRSKYRFMQLHSKRALSRIFYF
jgi:hypothetical protein